MRWDELFEDLEAQAESWQRAELAAEVADRTRSEIGQLTLLDRLRSNEGRQLAIGLAGGSSVRGTVVRLGVDWLLLHCPHEVVVPIAAVATVTNLPLEATSAAAASVVASRLTLASVLRAVAIDRARVNVLLIDSSVVSGTPDRIGQDFVDVAIHHAEAGPRIGSVSARVTVRYAAIAAVSRETSAWT